MSAAAVSLSFFDRAHGLAAISRAGMTLLFEGRSTAAVQAAADLVGDPSEGWRATLADRFELDFSPLAPEASLGSASVRLCAVRGRAGETTIDCLGTLVELASAPEWERLDATRSVSALFDREHAVLAAAERPRGARGHGDERVQAALLGQGGWRRVEDPRLSTVYDGEGRPRNAGLELWLDQEDFPRRASGSAVAGASLGLEGGLRVHAAVFSWRMQGLEGMGAYELTLREPAPEAA